MKKILLMIVGAFLLSTSLFAKEVVPFTVHYEDDQPILHGYGRTPMRPPLVYIEDYTLTFAVGHPDYTLII